MMNLATTHKGHVGFGTHGSCRGLTLVELILALTMTATICAALVTAVKATVDTWEVNQQDDEVLVSARNVTKRLRMIVGDAKLFGRCQNKTLVLWANDSNGNFQIEYSECAIVQYIPSTNELRLLDLHFPPGTPQGDIDNRNITLPVAEFPAQQLDTVFPADEYVRVRILAQDVSAYDCSAVGTVPDAKTIVFSFTLGESDPEWEFDVVATMRSPASYLLE